MPFAPLARPQSPLRDAITAAWREDEQACVLRLIDQARMPPEQVAAVQSLARKLVEEVRGKRTGASGVDALMQEFSLSSQEGIALMCLAEALLRIPDPATADRLIRDKLGPWRLARPSRPQPVDLRQRRDLGPADHRQAGRDHQREEPGHRADPPDRARAASR